MCRYIFQPYILIKGVGLGVLLTEGGRIGNVNDGCSPINVLREACSNKTFSGSS